MDSDTTITILGLLLLAAVLGLAFMARALEEARSHQQYLRGQVNKYRRMARGREEDAKDLGLVNPPGAPTGAGWDLDALPGRPGRAQLVGAVSRKKLSTRRDSSGL
jgi:hypothetical protein